MSSRVRLSDESADPALGFEPRVQGVRFDHRQRARLEPPAANELLVPKQLQLAAGIDAGIVAQLDVVHDGVLEDAPQASPGWRFGST